MFSTTLEAPPNPVESASRVVIAHSSATTVALRQLSTSPCRFRSVQRRLVKRMLVAFNRTLRGPTVVLTLPSLLPSQVFLLLHLNFHPTLLFLRSSFSLILAHLLCRFKVLYYYSPFLILAILHPAWAIPQATAQVIVIANMGYLITKRLPMGIIPLIQRQVLLHCQS
jgi:hypothetical protein